MFTKLRIWWLKRQARKVIHEINTLYDDYDCGNAFASVLAGYRRDALEYRKNVIINKLRKTRPRLPEVIMRKSQGIRARRTHDGRVIELWLGEPGHAESDLILAADQSFLPGILYCLHNIHKAPVVNEKMIYPVGKS